jgi:hypothetical protein
MTQNQKGLINHLKRSNCLSDYELLELCEEVAGSPVSSLDELDTQEASQLIEKLTEL